MNYEEEILKLQELKLKYKEYFNEVYKYKSNTKFQTRNENLKYMGIHNKNLPEMSDDIYAKIQDTGKYIWDLNNYDKVILPTLNKYFNNDNYYVDTNKTQELPGFYFVPYIDEPKFKKIRTTNKEEELNNIINKNNNIINEINIKLNENKIFELFDLIDIDEKNIDLINKKYDIIQEQIKSVIKDVQKMIKHTYRIDCPNFDCKENKMNYLKNNLLTRNYHKGLSSEYSAKILDTYSIISKNILLEYKTLLTKKIYQILNIDESNIIDYEDPKLNTNEDFIKKIINQINLNKISYLVEEELSENRDEKIKLLLVQFIINNLKKDMLEDRQINRLELQIDKKCINVYKIGSFEKYSNNRISDENLKNKILLEEILNEPDKKQLLYMTATYMNYYRKNNLITQEPFNERSFKTSIISWSNLLNKALTNCWIENSDHIFPLRLILHKQSGFLHFQSLYDKINYPENNEMYRFVGFFLVKFDENTNGLINMIKINNIKCKKYYDFTDTFKPKNSNYYTIFVFKYYYNNIPLRYCLFNFKCNEVYFGSTTEFKRILYTGELQQVISMNAQNKIYNYLLFEKANNFEELKDYEDLNNICTTKNQQNKKIHEECIEANLEPYFLNKLLNLRFYPYSIKNDYKNVDNKKNTTFIDEQHIFISKFDINQIYNYLHNKNINVFIKKYNITDILLLKLNYLINQKNNISDIKKKLILFIENNKSIYFKKELINIINSCNNVKQLINKLNKYNQNDYIEFTDNDKTYGLFQCHFDWSSNLKYNDEINIAKSNIKKLLSNFKTKINFYDKDKYSKEELQIIYDYEKLITRLHINERIYIKDGDMSDIKKKELVSDLIYIEDLCTFGTDILRDITPYFNMHSPMYYELYNLFFKNSDIFKNIDNKNIETNININFKINK